MTRTRRIRRFTVLAAAMAGAAVLLTRRVRSRRIATGTGGRFDGGGGLAGVREPRRPLPKDLTGAGAAHPGV